MHTKRPVTDNANPLYGVVQHLSVRWSKKSRGGHLASLRTQVPRGLPLPEVVDRLSKQQWLFVTAEFSEQDRFESPAETYRLLPDLLPIQLGDVEAAVGQPPHLRLTYRYRHGAPPRGYRDDTGTWVPVTRELLGPPDGGWIRVSYNRRFSDQDSGEWWYELHTISAGLFRSPPDRAVFTSDRPAQEIALTDRLW